MLPLEVISKSLNRIYRMTEISEFMIYDVSCNFNNLRFWKIFNRVTTPTTFHPHPHLWNNKSIFEIAKLMYIVLKIKSNNIFINTLSLSLPPPCLHLEKPCNHVLTFIQKSLLQKQHYHFNSEIKTVCISDIWRPVGTCNN